MDGNKKSQRRSETPKAAMKDLMSSKESMCWRESVNTMSPHSWPKPLLTTGPAKLKREGAPK